MEHPNQQPRQLIHSLSRSLSLSSSSHSLYSLSHSQAKRRRRRKGGERRRGLELQEWRWRSPRSRAPQEVRVEGGGALSPLPFGARRRRQEARTKSPKLDPASLPPLGSLHLSFAALVWFDLSQTLLFTFMISVFCKPD
jgi:hypothetical protein